MTRLIDGATWAARELPVLGDEAIVAGDALVVGGLARYRGDLERRFVGRPAGLTAVGLDGVRRWRALPGVHASVLLAAAGRLYVYRVGRSYTTGDVLDAATGARLGRWRLPPGTFFPQLVAPGPRSFGIERLS
jgi:hypothetical protein